jgi:hypothetical protein
LPFGLWLPYFFLVVFLTAFFVAFLAAFLVAMVTILPSMRNRILRHEPQLHEDIDFWKIKVKKKMNFLMYFFPFSRGMVARGIEKIDRGTRFFREIKFETRLSSRKRSEKFPRFAQSHCRMLMRLQGAPIPVATRGCAGSGCQMRRMGRILFSSLPTLIASLEAVAWKRS